MNIENSFDLLRFLKTKNLLCNAKDPFWWENSGSFEVVVGTILVQNTKWENVKKSLTNLRTANLLNMENLSYCDYNMLEKLIAPSGLYRQKAQRLILLSSAILNDFGNWDSFAKNVSREWLLSQKGIGFESADSILNYGLYREVMVADKYTQKLLASLGFEFYEYDDIQHWLECGIIEHYNEVVKLYGYEIELAKIYARFHAKIVEYAKIQPKGKK